MSEPSKKFPGKITALLVAAAIVGGAFFGVSWWEKDLARQIEENIKAVSGSAASVKVSFWDKSAVITGFKIDRSDSALKLRLEADTLTLSGVNPDALRGAGVTPLADRLTLNNARLFAASSLELPDSPQPVLRKREGAYKSIAVTGLRGDFAALAAELEKHKNLEELTGDKQALLRLIAIGKGMHADSIAITGYETRDDIGLPTPVILTMESQEIRDVNLLSCGQSTWKKLRASAMGREIVSVDSLNMRSMSIPDIFTPLVNAMPDKMREDKNIDDTLILQGLIKVLERESFALRGLNADTLVLRGTESGEPITLKNFAFDLELNAARLALKKSFEDLTVPPSIYREGGAGIGSMIARNYEKELIVSGRLDLLGDQKNGRIDLQVKEAMLEEKELGRLSLDAGLLAVNPEADSLEKLLQSSPDWLLKDARLSFEDKKALELAFNIQYAMLKAMSFGPQDTFTSGAELRPATAQQIRQTAAANSNPDIRAVMEGMAELALRPGILTIRLNPDSPQPLENIFELDELAPGVFKATAEHVPAEGKPQPGTPETK